MTTQTSHAGDGTKDTRNSQDTGNGGDSPDTQEPAKAPHHLPLSGWWAALKRTKPRLGQLNISLLASGVAYWAVLSIFPAILGLVTVYGLVASPEDVTRQIESALGMLSDDARTTIAEPLQTVASAQSSALGWGLLLSLGGLLWAASTGVQNAMSAITTAYEQQETRGFVAMRVRALVLTVGALLFAVVVIFAIGVVPPLLESWLGTGPLRILLVVVQFVILFGIVVGALALLYRFAPANRPVGLRWASAGALIGGTLWIIATVAFAIYVQNFSSYSNTYGALGGVIIFMVWLYYSAFVVLIGALINAEAEREAKGDGEAEPEGVDRDVIRLPQEEQAEKDLRSPEQPARQQ